VTEEMRIWQTATGFEHLSALGMDRATQQIDEFLEVTQLVINDSAPSQERIVSERRPCLNCGAMMPALIEVLLERGYAEGDVKRSLVRTICV
jgi:hypothetical protein